MNLVSQPQTKVCPATHWRAFPSQSAEQTTMDHQSPVDLPEDYTLIRLPEVLRITSLSRATLYRKRDAGEFPRPVTLADHGNRNAPIAFVLSEVKSWVRERINMRDQRED